MNTKYGFQNRSLHCQPTNLYIANLATADVLIGLFAMPFQFQVGHDKSDPYSNRTLSPGNPATTLAPSPVPLPLLPHHHGAVRQCLRPHAGNHAFSFSSGKSIL